MSLGHGARCTMVASDEDYCVYRYLSFNLNDERSAAGHCAEPDGLIWVPRITEYEKAKETGVVVENSRYAFRLCPDGVDQMAYALIRKILSEYKRSGAMPHECGIFK